MKMINTLVVLLTVLASANIYADGESTGENCKTRAAALAGNLNRDLAHQSSQKELRKQKQVDEMADRIIGKLGKADSAESLKAVIEGLRVELAVKPDSKASTALDKSVKVLQESGENTKQMFDDVISLNTKVGGILNDGWIAWGARKLPLVGKGLADWINRSKAKVRSGKEALGQLTKVVDERIKNNQTATDEAMTDELSWRQEYQALWDEADVLKRVRAAVKDAAASQDGLSDLQRRGSELLHEELADHEEIYRNLATQLQEAVQANLVIQKNYDEGTKMLQTDTKAQIRALSSALANMSRAEDAAKGFELGKNIKEATSAAMVKASEKSKELANKMIAHRKDVADKVAFEKARENRRETQRAWDEFDAEKAELRETSIAKSEERYKEGEAELQKHDMKRDVSNAVPTEKILTGTEAVSESKDEKKDNEKPAVKLDSMPH